MDTNYGKRGFNNVIFFETTKSTFIVDRRVIIIFY
jgi:hypothetical protein